MLGGKLKYLRDLNNKTQQDVADILGITRPVYIAYEQDKRNPNYEILLKISNYYNVSTDFLLGRVEADLEELKIATDYKRKIEIIKLDLNNSKYLTLEQSPLSKKERDTLLETLDFGIKLVKRLRNMNLEGCWTFAHSKDLEWENAYKTKRAAIIAGKKVYPCGFVVGQLKKTESKYRKYDLVNIEKITFS